MSTFAFKDGIKKALFPLTKMKHSQDAVAVDKDLISLLINDPLLPCQRLLWHNALNSKGNSRNECGSHPVIWYADHQERKQDKTSRDTPYFIVQQCKIQAPSSAFFFSFWNPVSYFVFNLVLTQVIYTPLKQKNETQSCNSGCNLSIVK